MVMFLADMSSGLSVHGSQSESEIIAVGPTNWSPIGLGCPFDPVCMSRFLTCSLLL